MLKSLLLTACFATASVALADSSTPYCSSLGVATLYSSDVTGGGWGAPNCYAGDRTVQFYNMTSHSIRIKSVNGVSKCIVQQGEYTWGCMAYN